MVQVTSQAELASADRTIERISTLADMDRIRSGWQALETRAANSLAYFQSYDWCRSWCAYYAAGASGHGPAIRIYTGYAGGRLVMVWPLMLTSGRRSIRKIATLTEPHCQYGNILVDPDATLAGMTADLIERCWRMIKSQEKADAIVFDSVPDGALPKCFGTNGDVMAMPAGLNSFMDLTGFGGSFEAYRAGLKGTTRRSRNKRHNKLAALGRLSFCVRLGGTPEYAELVEIGIAMKREWLERTGRATRALNLPHVVEFLGALSNNATGDNGAVAAALTLDGRPVAVEIGFLYHQRFYSYLGSFDWALRDFSPGKLQLEETLRWCLERRVRFYDLLGDPSAYKSDWSNVSVPLMVYRTANTIYGQAYLSLWSDNLRPILKKTFESIPLGLRCRLIPMAERHTATARALAAK